MKKQFLFGMAAVAALCSCSNNEVMEAPESLQTPVTFGTYVGNSVNGRAAVIDQTALESSDGNNSTENGAVVANSNKGFGVFAYYTEQTDWSPTARPNFMYNQQVTKSGTKWIYSPLKYWPNNTDAKVSFFAYAPYSTTLKSQNITITPQADMTGATLSFTVNPIVKDQVDLLWASVTDKKKNSTSPVNVNDSVAFSFNHALARVGFTVKAIVDEVTSNTGTLDGETTISVQSVELIGKFHKSATINLQNGNFSGYSTLLKDYTDIASEAADDDYKRGDQTSNVALVVGEKMIGYGFELTKNGNNFEDVADGVTTTETALNKKDSYIMLIPQNFDNTDKVRIRVTYTVTTEDTAVGNSVITNIVTSAPFDFNFEAKKAYTFNLQLGMTSVKFKATVTGWDSTTPGQPVDVPINTNN